MQGVSPLASFLVNCQSLLDPPPGVVTEVALFSREGAGTIARSHRAFGGVPPGTPKESTPWGRFPRSLRTA